MIQVVLDRFIEAIWVLLQIILVFNTTAGFVIGWLACLQCSPHCVIFLLYQDPPPRAPCRRWRCYDRERISDGDCGEQAVHDTDTPLWILQVRFRPFGGQREGKSLLNRIWTNQPLFFPAEARCMYQRVNDRSSRKDKSPLYDCLYRHFQQNITPYLCRIKKI